MKKLLIGLTILFSFLFISNVSAAEYSGNTLYLSTELVNSNTFITLDEIKSKSNVDTTKLDSALSYIEQNINDNIYYVIIYNTSNNFSIYTWSKDYDIKLYYSFSVFNNRSINGWLSLNQNKNISDNFITYKKFYFSSSSSSSNKSGSQSYFYEGLASYTFNNTFNSTTNYIYATNCDLYFNSISTNSYETTLLEKLYFIDENNNEYKLNVDDIFYLQNKEPQLEYKTGFISSEAYSVLGKVTNNFTISDNKFLLEYRNYKFKLQFGSNDFTNENIPVFSHYKIFGLNRGTNNYESLDKYFNDSFFTLDIIDTTYDYSEGMLADASITLQLNYNGSDEELEIFNTIYSQIKLEFYLDNTQNGYIYCYDNFLSSKWEDTAKFLEDYIYYYFPSNYKYAFITSNNNINEGKIYFPTNSINNELVKLQGQYYNLEKRNFSFPIVTNVYLNDDYYSYFDFYFNDTENILLLNRAVGSYIYESWYNTTFLEHWYESLFFEHISISEDTYFYVPIGYNVYFTNNTNITINTSNGNIDIDIENSKNDYENNIYNDNITSNSFFNLFIKSFNFFITPINSLFSLISLFFSILPIGIQYMFYASFGFIIALIIYKFVL